MKLWPNRGKRRIEGYSEVLGGLLIGASVYASKLVMHTVVTSAAKGINFRPPLL